MTVRGAPIPLYFDYETYDTPVDPITLEEYEITYYGHRFRDSLEMHKCFSNHDQRYKFRFPPN